MRMYQNITLSHLVLYLYNETEITDSVFIQHAIDTNYFVKEHFDELIETVSLFDSMELKPEKNVIDNILNYSCKTNKMLSN